MRISKLKNPQKAGSMGVKKPLVGGSGHCCDQRVA